MGAEAGKPCSNRALQSDYKQAVDANAVVAVTKVD